MIEEQEEPAESTGEDASEEQRDVPEGSPAEGSGVTPEQAAAAEEKLRRQLEEEVRNLRVQDVLLQSVVSLINLSARRIAKEDERDLGQAKIGIDAVRAVVDLLEGEAAQQVRTALSEVQVLYAKHAGQAPQPAGGETQPPPGEGEPPRKRDPRLWTPPGT